MFKQNLKKIQEQEQKDFKERMENFLKEFKELCQKYEIDFQAVVDIRMTGIIPRIQAINKKKSNIKKIE